MGCNAGLNGVWQNVDGERCALVLKDNPKDCASRLEFSVVRRQNPQSGSNAMKKWSKPQISEVRVGMEINCYACAER